MQHNRIYFILNKDIFTTHCPESSFKYRFLNIVKNVMNFLTTFTHKCETLTKDLNLNLERYSSPYCDPQYLRSTHISCGLQAWQTAEMGSGMETGRGTGRRTKRGTQQRRSDCLGALL